jgi:hypothetical protein
MVDLPRADASGPDAASATDLICANPCSKSPPIIRSMSMNRPIALTMKLFRPVKLHVTAVRSPSALKANSAVLVALKGLANSSLIRISSFGRLSVMVERPSPTSLLPAHE